MNHLEVLKHMAEGASIYNAANTYRSRHRGMGEAGASTAQLVLAVNRQFNAWVASVDAAKRGMEPGLARTLDNLVASATRSRDRFFAGEVAQGDAMQRTMKATTDLVREARSSNLPSVVELYDTTKQAIQDLVVGTAATAGKAAGASIKAAADALGVKPEDVGGGISKLATAAIVVGGAIVLVQLAPIIRRFAK